MKVERDAEEVIRELEALMYSFEKLRKRFRNTIKNIRKELIWLRSRETL